MLHEEIGTGINEKSKHYIEVIENAAAKMEQQMNALLAFYRVGQGDPKKENVDMTTILADVLNDFTDEIDSRGIRILIGPLPVVIGDRGALRVALCNLVSNAVKYTSKKDDPVIEIGFKNEGSEYIFYVRDNGAGFDMNYADKLFNVFKRLHNENEFKGIGIGLAMVKSIIERHGGRVWAEGNPGEGACFYFSLPLLSG
jgi:light-regulated signal transduction histidine kinase (bacteriophytochrome)